jgi:hypothetical protein
MMLPKQSNISLNLLSEPLRWRIEKEQTARFDDATMILCFAALD